MQVPPNKPHFFKPIQPGFKNGLKIPVGFLNYLKEHEQEHVVLRRAGKKWLMKLNDHRLEEGWGKFAEEHDLQLGDILVFRYEGDMEFDVSIFDSSQCDRAYAKHLQEAAEAHTVEETSRKFDTDKPNPIIMSSSKAFAEAATHNPSGQDDLPYFISTIKPYCISRPVLYLPVGFAKSNGLKIGKCKMILKDEAHRSWTVWLGKYAKKFGITRGWAQFRAASGLQVGDAYKFELIKNGKIPIAYFRYLRVSPSLQLEVKKNNLDDERILEKDLHFQEQTDFRIKTSDVTAPISQVFTSTSANPHFICTIKPYMITYSVLHFPMAFAKSNGLMKKSEMILVDERQRSWPVRLGATGSHFVIRKGGWTQFMKANDVQIGDTYKFELIDNGTVPTAYFHRKFSGKDDRNHRSHCQDNEVAGNGQVKEH